MEYPTKKTGFNRIMKACTYSFDGLKAAWRDEAAFRQEVILATLLTPLAFFLAPDRVSLAVMLGCLLVVLITELLNSAVEAAIDRHGPDIHPLAKKAKDAGSAAVMLALAMTAIIWILLLV